MSEPDSWTVWLTAETHSKSLQLEMDQVRTDNEAISIELTALKEMAEAERAVMKELAASSIQLLEVTQAKLEERNKQIDQDIAQLKQLVTVRDQEIAQLRKLLKEKETEKH